MADSNGGSPKTRPSPLAAGICALLSLAAAPLFGIPDIDVLGSLNSGLAGAALLLLAAVALANTVNGAVLSVRALIDPEVTGALVSFACACMALAAVYFGVSWLWSMLGALLVPMAIFLPLFLLGSAGDTAGKPVGESPVDRAIRTGRDIDGKPIGMWHGVDQYGRRKPLGAKNHWDF